jgi:hypothetical protein
MRTVVAHAVVIAAVLLLSAKAARAQSPCRTLPDEPNAGAIPKIYIENGDTQEPLIKRLGRKLLDGPSPLRVLYRNRPTCSLRDDLFLKRQIVDVTEGNPPARRTIRYFPVGGGDPIECLADAAAASDTPRFHLGIGATYLSSCPAQTQPADIAVKNGPVQAYGFVTKWDSPEIAITAEEGYLAFGFPEAQGDAPPWVVQDLRFKRSDTASTTLTIGAAIRVPGAKMQTRTATAGGAFQTSEALITAVLGSTNAAATLGILGVELYDDGRATDLKLLAFKAFGQRYAYFPDSTSTSFDKANIRDGHYLPWSPTPYIFLSNDGATPSDPNVKRLFDLVSGAAVEANLNGLDEVAAVSLVPECAMKVTRAGDGADLTLFDPPLPCGCYFDAKVRGGSTACTACTGDAPCNGGKCRFGYCEKK